MLDMDFSISEDTQAALLLCGSLGKTTGASHPLTLPQYNAVVQALLSLGKRPSDLLRDAGLAEAVCAQPVDNSRLKEPASPDRLKALLDRGFALSMALNRWAQYGVRPLSRGDALYPSKLKQHLKRKAPAILYYAGNESLWNGGGMAFVGSRDISLEATDAIRRVVRECVEAGMPIVSGGARGADQTSMRTALECGGTVVAALPGDLLKACLVRENREAIAGGKVLLFSAVDPDERFTPINAMDRNKLIYGMADSAFVAQSDTKGGTWTGAVEELKRPDHRPVYVYMGHATVEGCARLVEQGGIAWTPSDSLQAMLAKTSAAAHGPSSAPQLSLFDFMADHANVNDAEVTNLCHVSEPLAPCVARPKAGIYDAVLPLVLTVAVPEGQTGSALKKAIDAAGYFSPKGWNLLLAKACSDGNLSKMERPTKRGKPDLLYVGKCPEPVAKGGVGLMSSDSLSPMSGKSSSRKIPKSQLSLFDGIEDAPLFDGGGPQVCEPSVPYAAQEQMDVYTALLSVVVAELAQKSHTEATFRKAVDPDGYLSLKGWNMLVGKACADGAIVCRETTKKRGKTGKCYILP